MSSEAIANRLSITSGSSNISFDDSQSQMSRQSFQSRQSESHDEDEEHDEDDDDESDDYDEIPQETLIRIQLEAFIKRLNLFKYDTLSEDERIVHLQPFEAYEMFQTIETLDEEINNVKLENFVLEDYLIKNDEKLLFGIESRRDSAAKEAMGRRSFMSVGGKSLAFSKQSLTKSIGARSAKQRGKQKSPEALNYRCKLEITEKLESDIGHAINLVKLKGITELKKHLSVMQELELQEVDLNTVTTNFRLRFIEAFKDPRQLLRLSEDHLRPLFFRFTKHYKMSAQLLTCETRLKVSCLKEDYAALRADLVAKADLANVITAIHFEQLYIQASTFSKAINEKLTQMQLLKIATGDLSMTFALETTRLQRLMGKVRRLNNKIKDAMTILRRLERDKQNNINRRVGEIDRLRTMRKLVRRYTAPTVDDYMMTKQEYLDEEQDALAMARANVILAMKRDNAIRFCEEVAKRRRRKRRAELRGEI
ncbi:uncharacterized protein LOC119688000 [Teleopsis dalmanni]|uniref:uncharacterized protein LOC119688000 n=1 Tax=Teleopsis dalmanni TaxID=139649 RepID=UPI0018CEE155|nr:uncharacterized protein LOC119688000 [Teleopsis dalmanni]